MRKAISVVVMAASIGGCRSLAMPSTSISSQVDPTVLRGEAYDTILVAVNLADLEFKKAAEQRFAMHAAARSISTKFVPFHEVFFPGHVYSAEESFELLRKHGIDAVMFVTLTDAGVSTSSYTTPTTTNVGCTLWVGSECKAAQAVTTPGYTYSTSAPWVNFQAQMYDTRDLSNTVPSWYATGRINGNAFSGNYHLIDGGIIAVLDALLKDGAIH